MTEVEVDGERAWVMSADVDDLAGTTPTTTVRLVSGFDAWVLGPGTDDPRIVAPERRPAVSRQSGWIAPLVIAGGSVSGTWDRRKDRVEVDWFNEAGLPPRAHLAAEVERLSSIVGRQLEPAVRVV